MSSLRCPSAPSRLPFGAGGDTEAEDEELQPRGWGSRAQRGPRCPVSGKRPLGRGGESEEGAGLGEASTSLTPRQRGDRFHQSSALRASESRWALSQFLSPGAREQTPEFWVNLLCSHGNG